MASHSIWDLDGRALELVSGNASRAESDWVWLDGQPVAQFTDSYDAAGTYQGTTVTYLYADHLGTPRIGTDENKAMTWSYQSDAFGVGTPSGTASVRLRLPGQIDLGVLGISYNYFRDYDPQVGRYVESDPIGLAGGINTYAYGGGNPIGNIDPNGLFISPVHRELTRAATGRADLAKKVADVDFLPGSQDPWLAHWHAMRPPWKTPQEAGELYEWYLEHSLSHCTDDGLARALHAAQDSASAGHAGKQIWDGGRTFLHLPSIQHVIKDTWPTQAEWEDALQKTEDILRRYEERCSCQK